jgi:dUTP pyrophosphatase
VNKTTVDFKRFPRIVGFNDDGSHKKEYVKIPQYATPGSAGVDLQAFIEFTITLAPGETCKIPTGFGVHIKDPTIVGKIYPRSGLGSKGLILGNGTAVIDSDYQGQIFIVAWNRNTDRSIDIMPDDRIAQLVFERVTQVDFNLVTEFEDATLRGEGAFGSTGVK